MDQFQRCLCGVPHVRIFQFGKVGVVEVGDEMVLQGRVNNPALAVLVTIILVLFEEALILPVWRPYWDGCRSSWVGQADEGGVGDTSILLDQKDEPVVAVLTCADVALNQRHIFRRELMYLLDGGVVEIELVLGE